MKFECDKIPGTYSKWIRSKRGKHSYHVREEHLEAVLKSIFTSNNVDEGLKKRVIQSYIQHRGEDLE